MGDNIRDIIRVVNRIKFLNNGTIMLNNGTLATIQSNLPFSLFALGDVNLRSNSGSLFVDSNGDLFINSSNGAINIGDDDVDGDINIGSNGARSIQIGNTETTAVMIDADGLFNAATTGSGDIEIYSGKNLTLQSNGDTKIIAGNLFNVATISGNMELFSGANIVVQSTNNMDLIAGDEMTLLSVNIFNMATSAGDMEFFSAANLTLHATDELTLISGDGFFFEGDVCVNGDMKVNDLIVNNNLFVLGQESLFNVVTLTVEDNIIIAHATPFDSYDAGFMIERHPLRWGSSTLSTARTAGANAAVGDSLVVFDGSATPVDGAFNGLFMLVTSGNALGETRTIINYFGSNQTAVIDQPLNKYIDFGDSLDTYLHTGDQVSIVSSTSNIVDTGLGFTNVLGSAENTVVYLADGTAAGQTRDVRSIDGAFGTITLYTDWDIIPANGTTMQAYNRPDRYVGLVWNEDPLLVPGSKGTGKFYLSKTHRDLTSLGNNASPENANIDLDDLVDLCVGGLDVQTNATIGTNGGNHNLKLFGFGQICQNNTTLGQSTLIMIQNDVDQAMFDFQGTTLASEAIGNTLVTDGNGVGPNSVLQAWLRVNVTDDGGNVSNGSYHIPLYNLWA